MFFCERIYMRRMSGYSLAESGNSEVKRSLFIVIPNFVEIAVG